MRIELWRGRSPKEGEIYGRLSWASEVEDAQEKADGKVEV